MTEPKRIADWVNTVAKDVVKDSLLVIGMCASGFFSRQYPFRTPGGVFVGSKLSCTTRGCREPCVVQLSLATPCAMQPLFFVIKIRGNRHSVLNNARTRTRKLLVLGTATSTPPRT